MPSIDWPIFIAGIVLCAGGWLLYWLGIQMAGALVGSALGAGIVWLISAYSSAQIPSWGIPLGALIGFLLGIFLGRKIHRTVFFFLGSALGISAAHFLFKWLLSQYGWPDQYLAFWRAGFLVIGSVLGGICATGSSKIIMILATSLVGSILVVTSIADPLAVLGLVPLVIGSFLIQVGALRHFVPRRNPKGDER